MECLCEAVIGRNLLLRLPEQEIPQIRPNQTKKIPRQPRQLEFVKLTECKGIAVFTLQSVILKMCTQKWILEKHGKIPPCEKGTEI